MFISILRRIFKAKFIIISSFFIYIFYYFGIFTHIFERDFYSDFDYPLQGDVPKFVKLLRNGKLPNVKPINSYEYPYINEVRQKCFAENLTVKPHLVIIVKSALDHFEKRLYIRQTWGYEHRFSDVLIKTVFVLGTTKFSDSNFKSKLSFESKKFNDILQVNFFDSYFNNTIKTMVGIKWAVTRCPLSKFYLFVDDDYYISIKNVLMYVRNPVAYPEFLEETQEVMHQAARSLSYSNKTYDVLLQSGIPIRNKRNILDYELDEAVRLFAGYVFITKPHRHRSSKWYIPLSEYPWNMWPAYVTSGAYILSKEALHDLYYTSLYTKHFRFDDIFLGLVAMKAHIEPLHSNHFYFHKAPYSEPASYKYVIASHGFSDPKEMFKIWNDVRSAGYA
uniref:Hexosyltransferase n=1 Tax=Culicoides sonorensis TaxID=179676 RepID=A0A336LJU9_CULSO